MQYSQHYKRSGKGDRRNVSLYRVYCVQGTQELKGKMSGECYDGGLVESFENIYDVN